MSLCLTPQPTPSIWRHQINQGGYDLTIGTSERGTNMDDIDHTTLLDRSRAGDAAGGKKPQ
jgi:hypothetical protein